MCSTTVITSTTTGEPRRGSPAGPEGKRESLSSSSESDVEAPEERQSVILLQRGEELSAFATLLTEFGIPFETCAYGLPEIENAGNSRSDG